MSVEAKNEILDIESQVGKDPDAGMQLLMQREAQILHNEEEFHEEGEIRINSFTWKNQEDVCNFMNRSFPNLEELVLLS